jgi:CDP-6-deoxy-D-xylo-4-hexulose-3-dehydrase
LDKSQQIRQQIAQLVDEYSAIKYTPKAFKPGETVIPPSGKVLDGDELKAMVEE